MAISLARLDIHVGDGVLVIQGFSMHRGTVKWFGDLDGVPIAGVEMDHPVGTGTGGFNGARRFQCKQNHAMFVYLTDLVKDESKRESITQGDRRFEITAPQSLIDEFRARVRDNSLPIRHTVPITPPPSVDAPQNPPPPRVEAPRNPPPPPLPRPVILRNPPPPRAPPPRAEASRNPPPPRAEAPRNVASHQSLAAQSQSQSTAAAAAVQEDQDHVIELEERFQCKICLDNYVEVVFPLCGHSACAGCSAQIADCHMCRSRIQSRVNLY